MKKILLIYLTTAIVIAGCQKEEDFLESLPECSSDIVFTHSPIAFDDILRFIPLGHYHPSAHVFPTSHHYIDIKHGEHSVPVYTPCDGWITYVTERELPPPYFMEYSIDLWACKSIMIKYGHIPRLDNTILSQLGKVTKTDSYTTGGTTYNLKIYESRIQVKAGDKIAELPIMEGIKGMDFGSIDKRRKLPLIKPDRWGEYNYINAVSFLDYATPVIKSFYLDVVQNGNEGYLQRHTPPFEGQVCYDVAGTAQGIWFFPGKPVLPEDPHLALIRSNFKPEKNVFSMGTSVPGLPSIAYEFYPESNGLHNRSFDQVVADGQIYSFSGFSNIWEEPITSFTFPEENVILIQLIDPETLRIEQQTVSDGPPWSFKNNYRDFKR